MDFWQISHELYKVGKNYASAKANSEMLSESKHSVLASEASKHSWSEAEKNRIARCSDWYRDYLKWVQQARQKELELKFELDALNMDFEYQRSMNSLRKKEMNIL